MVRYKILQPSLIRFTTDQIPSHFDNGTDLNTTVENIVKGTLNPENIAAIRVFNLKGIYYTCDNRRLYVFRAAQHIEVLDYISVIVVSPCEYDLTVIKPGCKGKEVTFTGHADTYPHWSESWTVSPKEMLNFTQPRDGAKDTSSSENSGKQFGKKTSHSRSTGLEKVRNEDIEEPTCCCDIFCCFRYSPLEEEEEYS